MTLNRTVHYSATCDQCEDKAEDLIIRTGWFRVLDQSGFAARLRELGWQTGVHTGGSGKRKPDLCPDCVAKGVPE